MPERAPQLPGNGLMQQARLWRIRQKAGYHYADSWRSVRFIALSVTQDEVRECMER